MLFTIATISIYSIISIVLLVGLLNGLSQVCQQVKAKRDRINSIPFMTKKQLVQLARDYKVAGYSKYNKVALQNILVWELA